MNRLLLVLAGVVICFLCTDLTSAGIINPSGVNYMYYDWGTYPFYYGRPDDTGRDLSNGYLNGPAGDFDLNNSDWVEFINGGAKINFNLGAKYNLDSVNLGFLCAPTWGLPSPSSMDVSFSDDDVTFSGPVHFAAFQTTPDAGWSAETLNPSISLAGHSAKYVTCFVQAATPSSWFFLGEFTFSGTPAPEPATMTVLGLGALALLRKRS